MQEPEEGVIKFRCEHILADELSENDIAELKHFRDMLYMQKLIGVDENGIGYGNISQRISGTDKFIITGTQTGHLPSLTPSHFTVVEEFNIAENWLKCIGLVKASSESLTHAALYSEDQNIGAVIHVHHASTWQKNLDKLLTIPQSISYGSPEMACSIMKLCKKMKTLNSVIIMAGHKDGIIIYGEDLEAAYHKLEGILA